MKSPHIDIALSPLLFDNYFSEDKIVIVTDVLRATSAICTAFEYGCEAIIPVASIEEAEAYKKKGFLVGAERHGEKLPGFDFGNSPYEYMTPKIKGKTIVLTTTNGTKAIHQAKNAHQLLIGAFTNLSAIAKYVHQQQKDILVLCSGWRNKINLEDSLFAGALAHILSEKYNFSIDSDATLTAKYLYQSAKEDPDKFLRNSSHRKRLARLNLKKDVKYSLSVDRTQKIPIFKDGKLVNLPQHEVVKNI